MTTAPTLPLAQPVPLISRLDFKNFKSFAEQSVDFSNFTVLIGPNASGKSNLLSGFSFLKDVLRYDLDDAVSIQGGIDAVRCLYIPKTEPISLGFRMELPGRVREPYLSFLFRTKDQQMARNVYRNLLVDYTFSFVASRGVRRLRLISEQLTVRFEHTPDSSARRRMLSARDDEIEWASGVLSLTTNNGLLRVSLEDTSINSPLQNYKARFDDLRPFVKRQRDPIIKLRPISLALNGFPILSSMFKYDVDPKLGKNAIPVTGRTELEEDGDNLASALRVILGQKAARDMLQDLVTDALSFIKNVDVATFSDMTRFLRVTERYNTRQKLPGNILSDGTISVLTLIIALYFQSSQLTIFEEPDRGLHPALIRKIAAMMQEQSAKKQIIVSTHSPEFIDAIDQNVVLCTLRGESGFTRVFKPIEAKLTKEFAETMGIGRAYADNMIVSDDA